MKEVHLTKTAAALGRADGGMGRVIDAPAQHQGAFEHQKKFGVGFALLKDRLPSSKVQNSPQMASSCRRSGSRFLAKP
jgi:hypothetical protein